MATAYSNLKQKGLYSARMYLLTIKNRNFIFRLSPCSNLTIKALEKISSIVFYPLFGPSNKLILVFIPALDKIFLARIVE